MVKRLGSLIDEHYVYSAFVKDVWLLAWQCMVICQSQADLIDSVIDERVILVFHALLTFDKIKILNWLIVQDLTLILQFFSWLVDGMIDSIIIFAN